MATLELKNIKKSYLSGENKVQALKGISLSFEESEFVCILGQSGCGKTTLLNIVGGLDRYDEGDLVINGVSTKNYKDRDWDAYRNRSIGFVFQNYNLISHQTVQQNVEIAMTLSGVSRQERKERAKKALEEVGLGDQRKKRPNQLSGGQMQRVAIARALVNNPDIILADEPTGALDSQTSVQVMDILKEISKTRLVIMVTHNGELAEEYASRTIRLLDGVVLSDEQTEEHTAENIIDSQPKEKKPKKQIKKTSMSMLSALNLSFRNLLTKKGRTLITSFAGSIGIIGVALVLALSTGLTTYIGSVQTEALSGFPITISGQEQVVDFNTRMETAQNRMQGSEENKYPKYPDDGVIYNYDTEEETETHKNKLTDEYLEYVEKIKTELPGAVSTISYQKGVKMNILAKVKKDVVEFDGTGTSFGGMSMGNSYWQELPKDEEFILELYDLIGEGSRLPQNKNEIVLVVDEYNRIDRAFFEKMGISDKTQTMKVTDFVGKTYLSVVNNNDYYSKNSFGLYSPASTSDYKNLYKNSETKLTVTGVLRLKDGAASEYLSPGFAYTADLTDYVVDNASKSKIAKAQKKEDTSVFTGLEFANDDAKDAMYYSLGVTTTPTGISIYPKDFDSKDQIKAYLDKYNDGKKQEDQVVYSDLAQQLTSMIGTMINTVTYVLVGFAAISLVVSTIMIGIITYVSVIERTKEIGVLRSVGARKKDISRVFNAETIIIGFTAGLLGVGISYLLTFPINSLILQLSDVPNVSSLQPIHALVLVIGSMILTLIAGSIPSRMAANKDPVVALRTE